MTPSHVITYRLSDPLFRALAQAAKKAGESPHRLARRVLMEWLQDAGRKEADETLAGLRGEIEKLRSDLRLAVTAILCDAGKLDLADAEEWVEQHLFQ